MLDKSRLIEVIKSGDAEVPNASNDSDVGQSVLADEEVLVALARTAERVVHYRPHGASASRRAWGAM